MNLVFFDTETHAIDRGRLAPKIVCLSFRTEGTTGLVNAADAHGLLRTWLTSDVILVGHNVAFDLAAACATWPDLIPLVFSAYDRSRVLDTLIREKLKDIATTGRLADSYSLQAVAERYGQHVEKDGGWRTGYAALDGVPISAFPEGAARYAMHDAEVLEPIFLGQGEINSAPTCRADFALHLASCWGILTDRDRTERYVAGVLAELDRTRRYLQRAGLVRADGTRDTKKAKAYMERLCARRGKTVKRTEKGGVSLDADACTRAGSRLLELYAQFVSATGTKAKAEDLTYGYDLPLQTRYNSLVETSRTSSRKPSPPLRGLQIQNPPNARKTKSKNADVRAGFRECFSPDEVFIIADYPSAELHSFAQVCYTLFGYSALGELLNAGKDVHCELAAQTLGKSYSEVYAGRKTTFKRDRDRAKPGNYGFLGGMGPDKFILFSRAQYGILFSRDEVVEFKKAWQRMLPETVEFFAWVNARLAGRRECTIVHPITGFTRAGCGYCSGANFTFQSLTAEAVKDALWEVTRRCYADKSSALYGYRCPLEIHDELVLEGPERGAHEAAIELAQVMTERYNKYVPNTPLKVEACVSRFWSKAAEPVYGPDGRMIPWEGKEKGK